MNLLVFSDNIKLLSKNNNLHVLIICNFFIEYVLNVCVNII